MNLKTKCLLLFLICLLLSACSREVYQPAESTTATQSPGISGQNSTSISSEPVPTDQTPQSSEFDWENLYTETNPVTDSQELIRILQDLNQRFMNQLNKPGWYRFYNLEIDSQIIWIHLSEPESGRFDGLMDLYNYPEFYAPGFMWPLQILTLAGESASTGKTVSMDDYYFIEYEAPPPEPNWDNLSYFTRCDRCMAPLLIKSYICWIQDPDNEIVPKSQKDTVFQGWVGTYEDQPVFVFKSSVTFLTNMPIMESGERLQTEEEFMYFALHNGGAIAAVANWYYPSGNSDLGDVLPYNHNNITWFEQLPEREQTLYDEASRRLHEFINGN
ncbi:MAG: hypothetical protein IMZ64_08785 [Bacteroidetes bacterium]|nr:hypothetical protein [Bacteroidota bacterium]